MMERRGPGRPRCAVEGHRKNAHGRCLSCGSIRERARRHATRAATGAVIPAGMTVMQVAARRGWVTRRDRYGPTGFPAEAYDDLVAAAERLYRSPRHNRHRTHCKYGHPFFGENLVQYVGRRGCRTCARARYQRQRRGGRPAWIEIDGGKVSIEAHDTFTTLRLRALKAALIAAHPDKGGTAAKFIAARRALAKAIEQEQSWYTAINVAPPRIRGIRW